MADIWTRLGVLLLLGVGHVAAARSEYSPAIARAVALLPTRPAQVVVIDVNDARPEDRQNLLRLQAFVLRNSRTVYLTKHGEVLRYAVKGSVFHEHMLATVIWHEMAHVDGADEAEARHREEELWSRFIDEASVDRYEALRYLRILKNRPASTSATGLRSVPASLSSRRNGSRCEARRIPEPSNLRPSSRIARFLEQQPCGLP
jgi:hypothetical protein